MVFQYCFTGLVHSQTSARKWRYCGGLRRTTARMTRSRATQDARTAHRKYWQLYWPTGNVCVIMRPQVCNFASSQVVNRSESPISAITVSSSSCSSVPIVSEVYQIIAQQDAIARDCIRAATRARYRACDQRADQRDFSLHFLIVSLISALVSLGCVFKPR